MDEELTLSQKRAIAGRKGGLKGGSKGGKATGQRKSRKTAEDPDYYKRLMARARAAKARKAKDGR